MDFPCLRRECWDFIGQDLDLAIAGLPDKNDSGRATRYAAAALKSRAMLYAGSIAKYNTVSEEYLGKRICGIPAERAVDYFEAAYKASKIVDEGGYSLYKAKWAAGNRDAQAENFAALFLDESSANTETIFARYYKEKFLTHDYDNSVQPRSTSTGGNDSEVSPTVDFIEMFDGVELDADGKFVPRRKRLLQALRQPDGRLRQRRAAPAGYGHPPHVEVQGPVYRNPPRSLHRQGGRGKGISRLIRRARPRPTKRWDSKTCS
ncbi:MAG: hypothetical protein ACLRMJ_11445 [Alistipes finegoldii]